MRWPAWCWRLPFWAVLSASAGAKLSSAARSVNEAYAQNIAGDLALRAAAAQNISSPRVKRRWARMPRP